MSEFQGHSLIQQSAVPHVAQHLAIQMKGRPEPEALMAAVSSGKAIVKLGAIKALRILSESSPDVLYPHFEFFAGLLHNENSILRWNSMLLFGNLAPVDGKRRLDRMIDEYLAPISGRLMIDAANTMRGATAIAAAKPYLADQIASRILEVERATYQTPECRNVAIGHAIKCLDRLFPIVANKRGIQLFVSRQMDNSRAATRRKAEAFLRRWPMHRRT